MSDYSLQARESDTGRTLQILSHVAKLESALDMQRDEFKRVIALAPSPEIVGLCERAITAIEKTVPVVVERDKLQIEVEERRCVMADIVRVMGFGCSGLAGEQIAPAVAKVKADKNRLRTALAGLVGADGKDLDGMEAFIRISPHAPESDRAVTINAIYALRETLP